MDTPWIRAKDVPAYYLIGKTKTFELIREFRVKANKQDYIKDGRVLLIRKTAFEDFIRGRHDD